MITADLEASRPLEDETVSLLVEHHARFLAFLERRVGSRADAEEILQEAFVRSLERGDQIKERDSAVAWFYRLLRNAVIDHYRRSSAKSRALEVVARELEDAIEAPKEWMSVVCQCVSGLIETLKPEYADVVRNVDVDGGAVPSYAEAMGITPNHAGVRLHRAREALRKQVAISCGTCATHGCLDCSCGRKKSL